MTKAEETFGLFNRWHTGALGQPASQQVLQAFKANAVLIGPLPAADTQFRSGQKGQLAITQEDHIITGDPARIEAEMHALHEGLIETAAGGDLDLLSPPSMAR